MDKKTDKLKTEQEIVDKSKKEILCEDNGLTKKAKILMD